MGIDNFGGIYTPACDICGEELDGEFNFYDAVDAKKRAGWRSQKVNGQWEDVCPECQSLGGGESYD